MAHWWQVCSCPPGKACTGSLPNYGVCTYSKCRQVGEHCDSGQDCCPPSDPSSFSVSCSGSADPTKRVCSLNQIKCGTAPLPDGDKCCDASASAFGPRCCGAAPIGNATQCCDTGAGGLEPYDPSAQRCCANKGLTGVTNSCSDCGGQVFPGVGELCCYGNNPGAGTLYPQSQPTAPGGYICPTGTSPCGGCPAHASCWNTGTGAGCGYADSKCVQLTS